ncbi:oxidase [Flavobacterium sp. N1994]|uniref:oxidase n=1 Tax=Flavobacterium sp. N1994 TaxID=2986827 RepID=UPI0022217B03|nr:oxidase [Flavobacterium sp. N1994]
MKDILTDEDGDLLIRGGDIVIGDSDNQHQEDIILASKGEYKETPEIGVGIIQMLSDDDPMSVLIEIKKNLQYDGMQIRNVKYEDNGKITIDGNY